MSRRLQMLCVLSIALLSTGWPNVTRTITAAEQPLNVLLITVDDMNYDSIGVYGCPVQGITPNIDKLAGESLRFEQAHVTIAVCQPCRSVWFTGRYPHRNGAVGFGPIRKDVPTLTEQTRQAGYFNGIMAKVPHLAPQPKFCWDMVVPASELGIGRDPKLYYQRATEFFAAAKQANKPFFLMANSQDPHRPFAKSEQEAQRKPRKNPAKQKRNPKPKPRYPQASRVFQPEEITIPPFLPDIPDVRREIAQYYTSVHRADEIVGSLLKALDEAGRTGDTLVMFLSDHGMPLPFAKTNCYLNSTKTPWIVRWPGITKSGAVDRQHVIAGIDLMPTVLEILKLPAVDSVDGRSFASILQGKQQDNRDAAVTVFYETSGKRKYPMRSLVTRDVGYIYNGWADGKMVFRNESQAGLTMKAMRTAAVKDSAIAKRVQLFLHRVPEELYDYKNDPHALNNLIDDPAWADKLQSLRAELGRRLQAVDDPAAAEFQRDVLR